MTPQRLIVKSVARYKSFYRLIAVAVVVAVAVITGSLVVGDSVRNTLINRVDERLGKTETVIFSKYSYLDDSILDSLNALRVTPAMTRGILLMNGFVSVSGQLTPVMVWGTDDLDIKRGQAKINRALFNEINVAGTGRIVKTGRAPSLHRQNETQHIVLRLPAAGMVPLGSMYVTDTYTASLRLELGDVLPVEQGGNLNLKNEQTIPFNIFVNREELAEAMGVAGKINVILSDRIITKDEFDAAWNYRLSGLNVETKNGVTTITSDRIFIQDVVVETLRATSLHSNRIFTYLANSISINERIDPFSPHGHGWDPVTHEEITVWFWHFLPAKSIPYSFITAVDFYKGHKLKPDEIIISDYTARRLNLWGGVLSGDTISISYFVSKQFKTLVEDSVFLRVGGIVPIKELQGDKTLVADFPGLSNAARCTDWDSDLPIDMKLITSEDEDYWTKYKNTPKAIVPYSTLAPRWENAYGSATALQISDTSRLEALSSEMFDIQLIYPREAGIIAAKSGVDFSSLFLSLGIFIIISAAMLMMVPLSEMLFRRRDELHLLKATGFSNKRIARLLWRESTPIVFVAALSGVVVGLAYTYLILFLLGTVWKGATHTDGFGVYPDLMTTGAGMIVGIVLALLLLYVGIKRVLIKKIKKDKKQKKIRANFILSVAEIPNLCHPCAFTPSKLIWASIRHSKKQALLSFVTLALGVLVVFAVGLNRQGFADSSQMRTATGGFSLWCETVVPIYHNVQTEEGRAKLALKDLPENTHAIQLLKYSADDASCLNLNKVVTPNVLGIDMDEIRKNTFSLSDLMDTLNGGAFPALVDETVLQWSLGKKLGDTLFYTGEKGEIIPIVLAGTLKNSIFQGSILIDKTLFSEIWSEISGSEIMLVRVSDNDIADTKTLISQALNNYGVRVTTTAERLQLFHSVTDTYLTIFLTLGGLGLLLGIFSFVIVVRKNIIARTKEITLYRSLGFDEKRIFRLLYQENIIVPLCAIFTGALASLLGVSMGLGNVSVGIWILAGVFLAIFVLCVIGFVKGTVRNYLR